MSDDLTPLDLIFRAVSTMDRIRAEVASHPATADCPDQECLICGYRDCPYQEPLHYHHDGCPACDMTESLDGN